MKIKIALLFFVCCPTFAAQQKPESKVSKFFKNMLTCGAGFEAARPDYIERSIQAQREIGIPKNKIVKTYQLNPKNTYDGVATAFSMHLNLKLLDQKRYGRQRFVLLHEAAHIKNNDALLGYTKGICAGIFLGVVLIGSPGAAYNSIEAVANNIRGSCEHRADMQAAVALQCAPCLQEEMFSISDQQKDGYMSHAECQPILDGYLRDKKICGYHANQPKPQDECKE